MDTEMSETSLIIRAREPRNYDVLSSMMSWASINTSQFLLPIAEKHAAVILCIRQT